MFALFAGIVLPGQAAAQYCTTSSGGYNNGYGGTGSGITCNLTGTISGSITQNVTEPQNVSGSLINSGTVTNTTAGTATINFFGGGVPIGSGGTSTYNTYSWLFAPPMTATNNGTINSQGSAGSGIFITSTGALGVADQTVSDTSSAPNNHYMGRNAGAVSVTNGGTINISSGKSGLQLSLGGIGLPLNAGIDARSVGGAGTADATGNRSNGPGGDGNSVTITTNQGSQINLTGGYTAGLYALSAGGPGPGYSSGTRHNFDSGGNAGDVTVTSAGAISGTAGGDTGIFAISAGGSSGATDSQYSLLGGNAAPVKVELTGTGSIGVSGSNSIGIFAVSAGGLSWYADNGVSSGHQNGNGSTVTVTLDSGAQITTNGELGVGIVAASTGGNANTSEAPPNSLENNGSPNAVPTTRAPAGNADAVTVTNNGAISTSGNVAIGIAAVSATGGRAIGAMSVNASGQGTIDQVGPGSGSPGTVSVTNNGSVSTNGIGAIGIVGLSVGGSGGITDSSPGLLNLLGNNTSGNGANGNTVTVTNNGSVMTQGTVAIGVLAQSIGGSGGSATGTGGVIAVGTNGGAGGNGGDVTVSGGGSIGTTGDGAIGILAQTIGGGGGNGGNSTGFAASVGGAGGAAGNGAYATVSLSGGSISTTGDYAPGIMAQTIGGGGGNGGFGKTFSLLPVAAAVGGSGGAGGYAATGSVLTGAAIGTTGDHSPGVLVQSIGGGGGSGGQSILKQLGVFTLGVSVGGSGGAAGNGGNAQAANTATISTAGLDSIGMLVQSVGGGGGNGGASSAKTLAVNPDPEVPLAFATAISLGGTGGVAGDGHPVTANNYGTISTTQDGSHGIVAQSIGGGGGNGADSSATAKAVSATSSVSIAVAIGGSGGGGGNGGTVTVNNGLVGTDQLFNVTGAAGTIATSGNDAAGIVAQSIGGGGGNGGAGDSSTKFNSIPTSNPDGSADGKSSESISISLGSGVGGNGASGGYGGTVTVTNIAGSLIQTTGGSAQGILGQSIGGGGGNGGGGTATSAADTIAVTVTVGGNGGSGNYGGTVNLTNGGTIATSGGSSDGMAAQSIGGGGGYGGSADTKGTGADNGSSSTSFTLGVGVGGQGGTGSRGGTVQVANSGQIITGGDWSNGILAQSIGGGGGAGGGATANGSSGTVAATVSVAGSGGSGNDGYTISADNSGAIRTAGAFSNGMLVQSIGGGGGEGGASNVGMSGTYNIGVGYSLSAGGGGNGSRVTVTDEGTIATTGPMANAILAQSVGGGGGSGGAFSGSTTDGNYSAVVGVGGSGGAAGTGGAVSVTISGVPATTFLSTAGFGANGVMAQSIGGGGGNGGTSSTTAGSGTLNLGGGASGSGAGGGAGGTVQVSNTSGQIQTQGAFAYGILAESIGGGGGIAGAASNTTSSGTFSGAVTVGGKGGSGGNGGSVTVGNSGPISTTGALATAILAQSIGGGGGAAGAVNGDASALALTIGVGGSGGASGNGGSVLVQVVGTPTIATTGDGASGIVAQSIGGGGGVGGTASNSSSGTLSAEVGYVGSGGTGGTGGIVTVEHYGTLGTSGADAYGILAQSVGGSGGTAAIGTGFGKSGSVLNPSLSLTYNIGGGAGASGNGNTLAITEGGSITTTGPRSFGIAAQSIGGGGGLVTAAAQTLAGTGVAENPGSNAATGGPVTVTLNAGGSISTAGAGAWGILAQSIGGGGGLAGDPALSLTLPVSNSLQSTGLSGNAYSNTVTVNVAGNITTTGTNAHGVFAQAIGGSGGIAAGGGNSPNATLLAGNTAQFRGRSNATYWGSGGAITITQSAGSTIQTSGLGSIGIIAQSSGLATIVSPITITIGGTVIGGTNGGAPVASGMAGAAGILLSGGGMVAGIPNTVTVNAGGSVTTMDGVDGNAILVSTGYTNVVNNGTITGSVNLDDPGIITNTGVLNAGAVLVTSALINTGTLTVNGGGRIGTTQISGDFIQTGAGRLLVDVDARAAQKADAIIVGGTAAIAGEIVPNAVSLLPGTLPIVTAGSISASATVLKPLLFDWNPTVVGNTLTLAPRSEFRPQGLALTGAQVSLASYLTRAWNASDGALASTFGTLSQIQSARSYTAILDQASPSVTLVPATVLLQLSGTVLGSSLSCPQFVGTGTLLGEGSCAWAKVSGEVTNQNAIGSSVSSVSYRLGGQKEVAPDWFLGGSLATSSIWADEAYGSSSSGQSYDGSVSIKHVQGPWLLAGSLGIVGGSFANERVIDLPGQSAVLRSDSSALLVGGRVRAAYEIAFPNWYVRPFADFDLYHLHTPDYQESGASPFAANVKASNETGVAMSFAIEIGGRYDVNATTALRTYVDIGASVMPNNTHTVDASFVGALGSNGTFSNSITSPTAFGTLNIGAQLYQAEGWEVRGEYDLRAANAFVSQGGSLRVAYRF